MAKKKVTQKFLIHQIGYPLLCSIVSFSVSMSVYSEETTLQEADFDAVFLMGDAKKIDVSRFKYNNPVLPGEYNVDVYVNNNWFGKRKFIFKTIQNQNNATTCFDLTTLLNFGVKKDALNQSIESIQTDDRCKSIDQWVSNAFYEFDSSSLRLDISIPQIAMQKNAQGYVDPSIWDQGINAGFLSYSASAYRTQNNVSPDTSNAFMSIAAGWNLAGWQLRHFGQWQWTNTQSADQKQSKYNTTSTYIQKAFPNYRGVLTFGDSHTNGEVFDSIGYRGVDFSSDDRMLPNSMQGYAPQIRGNAKTTAKVEIRQQGQLIYQTTVSPGPFEINDLYPTGFGGAIDVTVIESDGQIQKFAVPYASVVQMLRPHMNRYSLTFGQFRDKAVNLSPMIFQGKYQHGLNNYVTGYMGLQATTDYFAATIGSAFSTPIGAISIDATQAQTQVNHERQSGQSFKISYSKLITPTRTNLTLAAYRYSTENFYNLRDAILIKDLTRQNISASSVGKQRGEFQMTLNQSLPGVWGNVYVIASWQDYWNRNETAQQYQIGYSNQLKSITYGISAMQRQLQSTVQQSSQRDTEYLFTLSFPLSSKKYSANVNASIADANQTLGVSGIANDRLQYGAAVTRQDNNNTSWNLNGAYKTNYATFGMSYNQSNAIKQTMLNIRGSIIGHSKGVLFGADQGQTMAIVYAPDAAGAKVNNATGLHINHAGYALVPYLTPYRLNDVVLDPQDMSSHVELEETSQRIAPYAGAISKINFGTKSGYAIYIESKRIDQSTLPFAAEVYNANNEIVGMVAQGSLVYVRSKDAAGDLTVKWGSELSEQCHIQYNIQDQVQQEANMIMTEAICK